MKDVTLPAAFRLEAKFVFEEFLRLSVADGTAARRTISAYREGLELFLSWWYDANHGKAHLDPRDASFTDVQEYRAWLGAAYKRSTVKLRLTAVRILFTALQRWGVRPDNPAAGVKAPRDRSMATAAVLKKALSPEETKRLLSVLPWSWAPQDLRDAAIVRVMLFHGLRAEEMTTLTDKSLDRDGYSWLLIKGKGGKERLVVLVHETRQDLMALVKATGLDQPALEARPLFSRFDVPGYRPLSVRAIERIVDHHLELAGLKRPGRSAHALRHTYGMLAILGGAKREAVSESMGHARGDTTDVYTRAAWQFQQNPAAAVSAALLSKEKQMSEATKIGSGKTPDGVPVNYTQEGGLVLARKADGTRVTHSDSIEGLKSAGYTVDAAPAPDTGKTTPPPTPAAKPAIPVLRKDVPLSEAEAGQLGNFRGQLSESQAKEFDQLLEDFGKEPMRPLTEILKDLDAYFPLTSAPGTQPTRVPVPKEAAPAK